MNASPAHQRQLLEIADLDRRIERAEFRRSNPEEAPRISELATRRQEELRELTERTGTRDDAAAELARIESDVSLAEQRLARDRDRLASATAPKDAIALEREVTSLQQRLTMLEDVQLELMAKLEDADRARAQQQEQIERTTAEGQALTAQAKEKIAQAVSEIAQAGRDRDALLSGISEELAAEYQRRAARGTGAALLRRGTCEGCQIMLASTDLSRIRGLEEDRIATCPECGCILVRTEESGL